MACHAIPCGAAPVEEMDTTNTEVRLAVMPGAWGWAVYAVTAFSGKSSVGWYGGEHIDAHTWEAFDKSNGREHTVRLGGDRHDVLVNGINGVAGMQYIITRRMDGK